MSIPFKRPLQTSLLLIYITKCLPSLSSNLNSYNILVLSPDNPCHLGWKKFNKKCYYVSSNGVSKTWANSRKDCQERGADLVIITTKEELDFVKKSYSVTWIGLSRRQGGGWTWVDGTDLEGEGFWQDDEPNNADGNENCVEVSRDMAAWNDVPCSRKFSWVCEELDRVRSHSSLSSQN